MHMTIIIDCSTGIKGRAAQYELRVVKTMINTMRQAYARGLWADVPGTVTHKQLGKHAD